MRLPLVLLFLLVPLTSWSAELEGRVVRIVDDNLVVLDATNTQHKIRLAGIDCPERAQPWGTRAKQALSDYTFDQQVTVESDKLDRYGRTVGKVLDGQQDVNLALVRDGTCWWYRKYAGEQSPVDQRPLRGRRRQGAGSAEGAVVRPEPSAALGVAEAVKPADPHGTRRKLAPRALLYRPQITWRKV